MIRRQLAYNPDNHRYPQSKISELESTIPSSTGEYYMYFFIGSQSYWAVFSKTSKRSIECIHFQEKTMKTKISCVLAFGLATSAYSYTASDQSIDRSRYIAAIQKQKNRRIP
jgi:hypothetical protein